MSGSSVYTIILEFRGGTYISQVRSENVSSALSQWIWQLKNEDLAAWKLDREALKDIQGTAIPVALTGCLNVWCLSGIAGEWQVLINVIKTAQE